MTTADAHGPTQADAPAAIPPTVELVTLSLALIVIGGIYMAAHFPIPPPLTIPILLLVASAALFAAGIAMIARRHNFAWPTFSLVGRWALLAYVISAGMIEFAFVRNHATGSPLLVVTLMLVMFAVDVPVIIAVTVARYQEPQSI